MIDYLTSRYATDAQVRRWVDNINIYVVPSVNPDGGMYVPDGQPLAQEPPPRPPGRQQPELPGGLESATGRARRR
jgi:murein tripeptide amidase MpaA